MQGFERVQLKAGETKQVTFTLSTLQMAQFDYEGVPQCKAGEMSISIGATQPTTTSNVTKKGVNCKIKVVGETYYVD